MRLRIVDINRVLEPNPEYAEIYHGCGLSYYYKGKYEKVWKDIQRCKEAGGKPNPKLVELVKEKLKGN